MRTGGMVGKAFITFIAILVFSNAAAQEIREDFPWQDPFEDDFREIVVDTTLFYAPLGEETSVFSALTRYGMSFVSYSPRGLDDRFSRASLAGMEILGGIDRYPDYSLLTALSALAPEVSRSGFEPVSGFFTPLVTEVYGIRASSAPQRSRATYTYSDRRYRTGIRFRSAGYIGKGWHYALSMRGRWGEDAFVKGVFTDAAMASLAVEKVFRRGGSVSLFVMVPVQERGMKGWSEAETYALTGNNLYNPYWGYFGGRIRNSRVRRECVPWTVVSLDIPSSAGVSCHAAVAAGAGERSRSGLWWNGAPNPAPDYYTNLPGHRTEPHVIEALREAWSAGCPVYTQIDWSGMSETNLLSGDGAAVYVADRRAERLMKLQAVFGAGSTNEYGFGYECGVRIRYDRSRFFREAADLLGGEYIVNVDPFTGADSDLRNPGREVTAGDIYDYDYNIVMRSATLYGAGRYRRGPWSISFGGELASSAFERIGHYEKEGLPGSYSYGSSGERRFVPYNLYICGRYNFTVGHRLAAGIHTGEYSPGYEDTFLSPDYCNVTIDSPRAIRAAGARMDYRLPLCRFARLEVAAYFERTWNETRLTRYYDDIYRVYSVLALEDISTVNWGLEAGMSVDITDRLGIMAAISAGGYTYAGNPRVAIREEANRRVLAEDDTAFLKGYVHSSSPQTVIAAAVNYSPPGQWNFTLQWHYAGRRYASVNPLRRTRRIAGLASSPEERLACIRQERLPDASVLNFSVSKGFTISGMRLFVSATVSNLLGRKDIIYGGYEQMRLDRFSVDGAVSYSPFPCRYSYSYPRTFLASLTVTF